MRPRIGRAWLAVAIVATSLAGAAVTTAAALPPVAPVVLPADHGAHPAYQVEWWYTTGVVADRRGRDYFWFATAWAGQGFVVARVNVVDLRADRIVLSREYVAAGALASGQRQIGVSGYELGWRPSGAWGRWSIDAPVRGGGRLALTLTPVQPYLLNGPGGIVQEGRGATSAYYSAPRVAARGSLVLDGHASRVRGQGWLDHQWGNFAANSASWHWNWFACQFTNRSDLMLYQFITPAGRPTGVQDGTFVSTRGVVTHPERFTVHALGPFIRPAGATDTYPLRWRLTVPSAHVTVTLMTRARHSFISNRFLPGFWEGTTAITSGPAGACTVESTRETSGAL
jgi:predicted secreted hydrolase